MLGEYTEVCTFSHTVKSLCPLACYCRGYLYWWNFLPFDVSYNQTWEIYDRKSGYFHPEDHLDSRILNNAITGNYPKIRALIVDIMSDTNVVYNRMTSSWLKSIVIRDNTKSTIQHSLDRFSPIQRLPVKCILSLFNKWVSLMDTKSQSMYWIISELRSWFLTVQPQTLRWPFRIVSMGRGFPLSVMLRSSSDFLTIL